MESVKLITSFSCIILAAAMLNACSKLRTNIENTSSTYQYPHPENWTNQHVLFYVEHAAEIEQNQDSCKTCHENQQRARPLRASVSCGSSCHTVETSTTERSASELPTTANYISTQCLSCHNKMQGRAYSHYPFTVGICEICHNAQPSHLKGDNPKAVQTYNSDEACYRCHFRQDRHGKKIHAALTIKKGCVNCHDPHGSSHRFYLADNLASTCLGCHTNVPHSGKSVHGVLASQQSCLSCHLPHSSAYEKLLLLPQKQLCLACHDREIVINLGTTTRVIPNIKKKVDEMPFVHSPAGKEGGCTDCHNPHASQFERLLVNHFSTSVYNYYSAGDSTYPNPYALCLDCHGDTLVNQSSFETGFRNDLTLNLHWYHVVDAAGSPNKEMGKSCKICHDPHGAPQKFIINSSWPLNNINVNITFTPNTQGGQCSLTCHDTRVYKR